jgi:hypothetical protein
LVSGKKDDGSRWKRGKEEGDGDDDDDENDGSDTTEQLFTMKVNIKSYHAVATWEWNLRQSDDGDDADDEEVAFFLLLFCS